MLARIGLQYFKAFRRTELELKPITVLAGANSAGKSTLIQALLLLKQSLEGPATSVLTMNGPLLNVGRFQDMIFEKQEGNVVSIDLELTSPNLPRQLNARELRNYFNEAEIAAITEDSQPERVRNKLTASFGAVLEHGTRDVVLTALSLATVFEKRSLRTSTCDVQLADLSKRSYVGTVAIPIEAGVSLENSIPEQVIRWSNFLPANVSYRPRNSRTGKRNEIPFALLGIPTWQEQLSTQLHYIGPLRSEPQRAYLVVGDRPGLDSRGETVPQILSSGLTEFVDYLVNGKLQQVTLLDGVNHTLAELGLTQMITPDTQDFVFQLLYSVYGSDSQRVTFADVGFGNSQLLPIVVAGLRAARGDTIIFDHPETHLHPRVQSNLAKFFVHLLRLGKQVLIETQSDHLITGLRQQIAKDTTDDLELANKISIAFVRPSRGAGDGASIQLLELDEFGLVANWPPEFMPQSMTETQDLLRAAAEKRRTRRAQRKDQ